MFIFSAFQLLWLQAFSIASSETTVDLIEGAGYPAETHHVITDDGYILAVHRIPQQGSPPVLYLHGYQSSSAELVLTNQSLGFMMSDQGYDVWLINFRGNAYSRNHTFLDPDKTGGPFWNFTWWEMGTLDLPRVMEHVISTSNTNSRLQVVGHSQGMSALYVMLSNYPSMANNISLISGMAPISYNSNTQGLLRWFSPFLTSLSINTTQSEFLRPSELQHALTDLLCSSISSYQDACYSVLFLVTGPDPEQQDKSLLTRQLHHFPSGTSARTIVHTAQLILSGRFQAYDWGDAEPSQVDLSKVTTPHALYLAQGNDYLVQPKDYTKLIDELPNVVKVEIMNHTLWNHMDFLVGKDAPRLLYETMLDEMGRYKD